MGTKIDSRFMYLRFEQGLTEAQMNSLVNEIIASNELLRLIPRGFSIN